MKIFWSWQSDTPGKIGRHFVRDVLADVIKVLKQPEDVEEPSERDARQSLHLDHDRQGVSGSPDLAPTIFRKIERAAVFVADVTLIAEIGDPGTGDKQGRLKKLINSNVAIEYGYALRALGDEFILMVQNAHYGDRDELPFDLKHKAGPIQYRLAPGAAKADIASEHARLRGILVDALRPYLGRARAPADALPKFPETPSTTNIAFFWNPPEILARIESSRPPGFRRQDDDDDAVEYRFNEQHPFYLRLIPTEPIGDKLTVTALTDVVQRRRVQVLTRTLNGAMPDRNRFGAISFEPHGTSTTPTAFTQLFRNGEIWGVSREFTVHHERSLVVPMMNIDNIFRRVLANFIQVAGEDLGIPLPYQIEIGAVGLKDVRVSLPRNLSPWSNAVSEPIYENQLQVRRVLNDPGTAAQKGLIEEFLRKLYDLAAVTV
jgi:hypothetical protein